MATSLPVFRVELKTGNAKGKALQINKADYDPKLHQLLEDPEPTAAAAPTGPEMLEIVDPTDPDVPLQIPASAFKMGKHRLWKDAGKTKGRSQAPAKTAK